MFYFVKKPRWVRRFYGDCTWEIGTSEKVLYLSFDDGPDERETPFVLEQLSKYNAKGTFFCIGKNVLQHPGLFESLTREGHTVGNHTFSHIDGWKTSNKKYFDDIAEAAKVIRSGIFRPPYGHVTWNQVNRLKDDQYKLKIILWSVLSADFNEKTPKEKCLANVVENAGPGSIVLFHDSSIASRNLRYALPGVLEYFSQLGYRFEAISG
jgi:peptidoglycan/xylan/chitin deacetylase (PgdA/CDA1 family)